MSEMIRSHKRTLRASDVLGLFNVKRTRTAVVRLQEQSRLSLTLSLPSCVRRILILYNFHLVCPAVWCPFCKLLQMLSMTPSPCRRQLLTCPVSTNSVEGTVKSSRCSSTRGDLVGGIFENTHWRRYRLSSDNILRRL